MAKYFKTLVLSCLLLLPYSCQEGSEAGDLLGQWRLEGSDSHYVNFSGNIIWLRDLTQGEVFGNFQQTGDSLFMHCYSADALPTDTLMVEQDYGFKPMDNIRLKIEKLTGDDLILSKDGRTWNFYKY